MTAPVAGFPTAPQQQPPQGQQQQQQPPFQQQPTQQQQGQQPLDMNARLSGPNIPQELQGKTVGEAIRYYGVMRQDFINRNYGTQQQQGAPPVQQQQQQQQQQQGWQQQPRQQNGQWQPPQGQQQQQDPQFDAVARVAQEAVQRAVAPLQQASIGSIYQQVSQKWSDWRQYDAEIQEALVGADPGSLLNPSVWEAAYFFAKGKRQSQPPQQQFQGQPQVQPQQQNYGQQQPWEQNVQGAPRPYQAPQPQYPQQQQQQSFGYPGQPQQTNQWQQSQQPQQPQYQQPAQQQQQPYFVEAPTPQAPQPGLNGNQAGQAGPADEVMARRFGIPVEEYRAFKGGNVPPPVQPQSQQQSWQQWNPAAPQGYQPPPGGRF